MPDSPNSPETSAANALTGSLPTNQNPNAAVPLTALQPNSQPTPGAAIAGTQPQQAPQAQPAQPQNPAVSPAAVAQAQRHRALGRLAESLLGNETSYQVNPQTGQMEAVRTPAKPGDLFRRIVAGAIMGTAAAAQQPAGTRDFASGLAGGAGAAFQYQQEQDANRRAQAEQSFQNQMGIRKQQDVEQKTSNALKQAELRASAQQQTWNMAELRAESTANLKAQAQLDRENTLSQAKAIADEKAGGQIANGIPGNAQLGNGRDMQRLYVSQPGLFAAPANYETSIVKQYDLNGLHYDFKTNGWEDEDNNPANLEDHTTWTVRFVPLKARDEVTQYSGAQLAKYFPLLWQPGQIDPKQTFNVSFEDFTALAAKEHTLAHQDLSDSLRESHDRITTAIQQGRLKMDSLRAEFSTSPACSALRISGMFW